MFSKTFISLLTSLFTSFHFFKRNKCIFCRLRSSMVSNFFFFYYRSFFSTFLSGIRSKLKFDKILLVFLMFIREMHINSGCSSDNNECILFNRFLLLVFFFFSMSMINFLDIHKITQK